MTINVFINIVGLLCTAFGALISAFGAIRNKKKDIFTQASTYFDYNREVYKALLIQKYYSLFGFVFILVGTIMQILSNVFSKTINIDNISNAFIKILFMLIVLVLILMIKIERTGNIGTRKMEKEYQKKLNEDEKKMLETDNTWDDIE